MPKRSKNSTDGAVFTYHERRKIDAGTTHLRLPDAALKPWYHCALSLHPPSDPVITPSGVLYSREAILRELLRQRTEAEREREEEEEERRKTESEQRAKRQEEERQVAERFELAQSEVIKGAEGEKQKVERKVDSSFWLPEAKVRRVEGGVKKRKISLKSRCPISKKSLRVKDLINLKLKKISEGVEEEIRYECPVCQSVLRNASKPVALRTGTVLCAKCVSQFVLKEKRDPVTGENVNVERDVIPIFNVGTAFAGSVKDDPASREAKLYRPSVR